ncbi:MAG TPA: sugar ABC transporter permease [Catenuloplanes sp.]|jgi:xylobiose transport system permease protein
MTSVAARHGDRPGAAWAAPGVAFFTLFAVVPMVLVGYLSLTAWNGLGSPRFVGVENWSRLVQDPVLRNSLWLSAVLTALTWVIQTPISLLLGVWAAGRQRNRAVLSAIFFLPLLLSSAAIAIIWKTLLDPNFGLISVVGPWIGLPDGNFIGTSRGAMICVAFAAAWQFIPFHALLYQGGTRQIPASLYEAATIDGAGRYRQLRHITLPQLRNTIISSSVLMIVGALTFFDTVLIMTQGGPGTDTDIVPYRMYVTAFKSYDMGYGSAIAFALVLVTTAVSLLLVRLSGFGAMRSTREGM